MSVVCRLKRDKQRDKQRDRKRTEKGQNLTMKDAASEFANQILGRAQISSNAASRRFRAELTRRLRKLYKIHRGNPARLQAEAGQVIAQAVKAHAKVQRRFLGRVLLFAWIAGLKNVIDKLPAGTEDVAARFLTVVGPPEPPGGDLPTDEEQPGPIRFPKLEAAAKDIEGRKIMTARQFYSAAEFYDRRANFTVSRFDLPAIEKIRGELHDTIADGPTLGAFEKRMRDAAIKSPLGPGHLENVFRTNTITAMAEGEDKILENPVIGDAFPYSKRLPIFDARLTELCREIAQAGIGGGPIFRRDDPVYRLFRRPSHFQCRCSEIYLTAKQAAAEGIAEAQEFVKTGIWPSARAWVDYPKLSPEAEKTWQSWRRVVA